MDLHLIVPVVTVIGSLAIFVWRTGVFTGRLEEILKGIKEDLVSMKAHEVLLARHDERITALEKKEQDCVR